MILHSIGANIDCLKTSPLIFAAMASKDISASVTSFLSSDSSENGTDLTSPVDKILISAICLLNTDFLERISIPFLGRSLFQLYQSVTYFVSKFGRYAYVISKGFPFAYRIVYFGNHYFCFFIFNRFPNR